MGDRITRTRVRWKRVAIMLVAVALASAGTVSLVRADGDHARPDARIATGRPGASPVSPPTPASSGTATTPPSSLPYPIPGYLLIADRGNNRVLLVDSNKHVLWTYPKPGTTPDAPFRFDDDAFFTNGYRSIITNQEDQQTIQIISFPEGRVQWMYGHPGKAGSSRGYLHTPDDAYRLADGTVTVADVDNCRILFISPAKRVVRQIGTTGVCAHGPPTRVDKPNGDTPMPGGTTLVTEIHGSWVQAIGRRGKVLWSFQAPIAYPSDAQWLGGGRVLLADYSYTGHVLIMSTKGKLLWKYGPDSGPGRLSFPSLAMMLPNGLIAVNDDVRDRVVLIDPKTNRIVWQYGVTDTPGTGPGHLDRPDGMDFLPSDVALASPTIRRIVKP